MLVTLSEAGQLEPQRADLAVLVVLLGSGIRTHAGGTVVMPGRSPRLSLTSKELIVDHDPSSVPASWVHRPWCAPDCDLPPGGADITASAGLSADAAARLFEQLVGFAALCGRQGRQTAMGTTSSPRSPGGSGPRLGANS